jgi:hypothetical protein
MATCRTLLFALLLPLIAAVAPAGATSPCCSAAWNGTNYEQCVRASDPVSLLGQGGAGCIESGDNSCVGGFANAVCVCLGGVCLVNEGTQKPVVPATTEQCAAAAAHGCCRNQLPIRNCLEQ